jgi:predicted DNA-binding ribbon-helix-helix protein
MRTTLQIDDHVLDAVREMARSRHCSAGAMVTALLKQALLGERSAAQDPRLSTTGAVNKIRAELFGSGL